MGKNVYIRSTQVRVLEIMQYRDSLRLNSLRFDSQNRARMMLERARLLTGHYSKRSNDVSNNTGKYNKPSQAGRPIKSGAAMAALLKGCRNIPVMFVNPKWSTNTEEDRWIVILPIAGSFVPVQTGLQGYQPKADLRQFAQALLMKPERALDMLVEMPDITDTESVKQIAMLIPVLE